jgi:hypothetical protein
LDTLRDFEHLAALVETGEAPWQVWAQTPSVQAR